MKSEDDGKRDGGRDNELRALAKTLAKQPPKGGSVDEMSLESRRRAIAYGRARGNA